MLHKQDQRAEGAEELLLLLFFMYCYWRVAKKLKMNYRHLLNCSVELDAYGGKSMGGKGKLLQNQILRQNTFKHIKDRENIKNVFKYTVRCL